MDIPWDVINSLILLANSALGLYGVWMIRRTEKNTNSMKDALVASTAKASRAEGVVAGKQEEKDEQMAKG
jgi:hypothetical protein